MKRAGVFLCLAWLAAISALAQSPVTITLGPFASGKSIPADFCGLSFETLVAMPGADGQYIFSRTNKPLVALFKTLGIGSLRIGGNTADLPKIALPRERDIDELFGFAKAANVKLIYTLRLRNGDIARDIAAAQYIEEHYKPELTCFAIGNEPDYYRKVYPVISNYTSFRDEWKKFAEAIAGAVPGAKFCGPCSGEKTEWSRDFANDLASSGLIESIAQHDYPGGPARRTTNATVARDKMLSPGWLQHYQDFYNAFAATSLSNGLAFRFEEANNFSDGGVKGASDSFAAALWSLDYLHWWAGHDASGINLHGRRWVPNCLLTNRAGLYEVRPIAYGIKAFDLGGHGCAQPISVANPDALNLTAYAVRDGKIMIVTVLNKEHGDGAREATITVLAKGISKSASVIFLAAPNGNVAAQAGVTLGGAPIQKDGSWREKWTRLKTTEAGVCTVHVPPASAAIVKFSVAP